MLTPFPEKGGNTPFRDIENELWFKEQHHYVSERDYPS